MAAVCSRCGHYIFVLWFLSSIFFSYFSPNLSGCRLDVYHTSTIHISGMAKARVVKFCTQAISSFSPRMTNYCVMTWVWSLSCAPFLGRIAVLHTLMRPIVTERLECSVVCRSVCLSWSLSLQKRLSRLRCRLGWGLGWAQGTNVLNGGPDPPWEGAVSREKRGAPIVKYRDTLRSSVQIRLNR